MRNAHARLEHQRALGGRKNSTAKRTIVTGSHVMTYTRLPLSLSLYTQSLVCRMRLPYIHIHTLLHRITRVYIQRVDKKNIYIPSRMDAFASYRRNCREKKEGSTSAERTDHQRKEYVILRWEIYTRVCAWWLIVDCYWVIHVKRCRSVNWQREELIVE